MNKITQMRKIIEAFGDGTIGTASGVLGGLYFSENVFVIVLLGGVGAVVGQVLFPLLADIISKLLFT